MPPTGRLQRALGLELLPSERASGLEHAETRLGPGLRAPPQQALVEKCIDPVEHIQLVDVRDRFRSLKRPASGERRESSEERLLIRRKELVTPVDGRL